MYNNGMKEQFQEEEEVEKVEEEEKDEGDHGIITHLFYTLYYRSK